ILGTEFLTAIKDIFPQLLFMPTGGVDATKESIESWYKAGVCAVGLGSKLVSKKLMETKKIAAIEKATKDVLEIVASVKKSTSHNL
ncbi:MAG: bifunctional 4-hydroxy-2-oxoglutarate aldolase/2-dehydro-3-deoxy-phosphogluconate aldolase, partial [Ferruginibacter sp.]